MNSRFPRAVGKQPTQLGGSFFDWDGDYRKPAPLARTPASDNFWNAGVNMAYGREAAYAPRHVIRRSSADSGLKPRRYKKANRITRPLQSMPAVDIGIEAYNRAQTQMLYGNPGAAQAELGDLFNDIMGAIVPGWASRPDALKKIVLKPDANKIMETAQRIAPNAGADIVRAANANGLQVYVNTPAGQINVSPETAQTYYGNYQFLTRAQDAFGSLASAMSPTTLMIMAAAGFGLFLMLKR